MQRRRYEILLPLTFNDGSPVPGEAFEQTREELVARFGAVSMSGEAFRGVWVHEGSRYEDQTIRYFLDVEDTPEARQFFVEYKPTLRERFKQIEVYVTSIPIDVI